MDFVQRVQMLLAALAPAALVALLLLTLSVGSLRGRVLGLALAMGPFAVFSSLVGWIEKPVAAALNLGLPPAFEEAFLRAALPEEVAKLLVLTTIVLRHEDAVPQRDGILAGAWLGLGFGLFENFFYVTAAHEWLAVAGARAAISVPFHVGLGMVMGFYVGRATSEKRAFVYAVAVPILLHGLSDWGILGMRETACPAIACAAFGAMLVAALVALSWLMTNRVATDLCLARRAIPESLSFRALRGWATGVAIILRTIGFIALSIFVVGVFAGGGLSTLFLPLGIMPVAFAALWRSATADTGRPRSFASA
jgi:RsiW-degrading membrane proteinase PrsW (M82 family)